MIAERVFGDEDLPVVPGEVTGWRAWIVVTRREPWLRSLYFDVIWPTDAWLVAEDGDGRGDEPHGICAARDREHLVSMYQYVKGDGKDVVAIGEVGLAGKITPGDRGFRAEKARPLSILLPFAAWELVDALARAYRVPVGLANVLISAGGRRGHRA